jgi:hypothetical protein
MTHSTHISGALQAISIVSNSWTASLRFYTQGLGYQILHEGYLSVAQRNIFGEKLGKFTLLGHAEGSVVRLIELDDTAAQPNRVGARPWDCGMCVFEAGTPDVNQAYFKVMRAKFGAIAPPTEFDCQGPEPLGYVLMRSTAFIGPAGEQVFVTQIVGRQGGQSLLKEQSVDGINTPANVVISLKDRSVQRDFWGNLLGVTPVNDLVLRQPGAAAIMAGPSDMAFDMCLMGHGQHRIGLEQHVYAPHNPTYDFRVFPCTFEQTGLASAAWLGKDLAHLDDKLRAAGYSILGHQCLPIRGNDAPEGLVFRGPYGEILELIGG